MIKRLERVSLSIIDNKDAFESKKNAIFARMSYWFLMLEKSETSNAWSVYFSAIYQAFSYDLTHAMALLY